MSGTTSQRNPRPRVSNSQESSSNWIDRLADALTGPVLNSMYINEHNKK